MKKMTLYKICRMLFFSCILSTPLLLLWLGSWVKTFNETRLFRYLIKINTYLFFRLFDIQIHKNSFAILPKQYLLIANHASAFDGFLILHFFPGIKLVGDIEHEAIPILGRVMKLVNIGRVDRSSIIKSASSFELISNELARKYSVAIFPQGETAEKITSFKMGAFILASEERLPLVHLYIEYSDPAVFYFGPPWKLLPYFKKILSANNKHITLKMQAIVNTQATSNSRYLQHASLEMYQSWSLPNVGQADDLFSESE